MIKSKTKIEFEKWVSSLASEDLNSYDKKLLNLLYTNFDELYPRGLRGSKKRDDFIIALINEKIDELSEISFDQKTNETDSFIYPFDHVNSLEVESFRGFIEKDIFEFSKNYNLVFGKNGSGKSSFFEALEYAFLGDIEEAHHRGLKLDKYIINTATNKGVNPLVYCQKDDDDKVEIEADQANYRWMFIEKNRINNFSRVSASTPSKQTEILSNLFGLEDFNEFVKNFTENFSIPKEDENAKKLTELKQRFTSAEITLKKENENFINSKSKKEKIFEKFKLSADYYNKEVTTADELKVYLNSDESEQQKGRIAEINDVISSNKKDVDLNPDLINEIISYRNDCLKNIELYEENKKEFDKQIGQINLKDLYEKALNVENEFLDKCPLCLTPMKGLRRVRVNPYVNAREQLALLKGAEELRQKKEQNKEDIINSLSNLQEKIKDVNRLNSYIKSGIDFDFFNTYNIQDDKIDEIKTIINNCDKLKNDFLNQVNVKIKEIRDKESKKEQLAKVANNELTFLQNLSNELSEINIIIDEVKKRRDEAQMIISAFENSNKNLITKVEKDNKINSEYAEYEKSYQKLYSNLNLYKERMPLSLISGLNEKVVIYFNIINDHEEDRNFEVIEKIEFPVKANDDIVIYFKDEPDKAVNALHVLSEGHLKCLGLAIIIAKSVSVNVPTLIFDDVINAIDDDHREGVRDLLFSNSVINERQIILTSHGEQFITQTVNEIKKIDRSSNCTEISFILAGEKGIKSIKDNTRHYLINAKKYLDKGNESSCMKECRFALPSIIFYLWKKIKNKGHENSIGVQQRYGQEPELRSIVCGIRKNLKNINKNAGVNFKGIPDILDIIIENNNWDALNTGSHYQAKNEQQLESKTVKIVFEEINKLSLAVDNF